MCNYNLIELNIMFRNVVNIFGKKNNYRQLRQFSSLFFDVKAIQNYKDISSHYRGSVYHQLLYDLNLKNLLNSMFLITKKFDTLLFIGPNPEIFLQNKPASINKFKNYIWK